MKKEILRRIGAIFIAVCVAMPGMSAFAGNTLDESAEEVIANQETIFEEFNILNSLGIMGKDVSYELLPYENLTLGELYGMYYNIKSDYAVSNIRDTQEVSEVAARYGDVLEGEDLTRTVSCIEAVKLLLELTGILPVLKVENPNLTDSQYMTQAEKAGILDGIKITPEKVLDRITAMRIVFNAVNAKYTEVAIYSNGYLYSYKETERSVIHEYRNIYEIEGILTQTSDASLYGETEISDGLLAVDARIYGSENDYSEFLGFKIEGYAQHPVSGLDKILHIEKSVKQKVVEIDAEDIESVSANMKTVKYYIGDRLKSMSIIPSMRVIYNGAHFDGFTAETLKPDTGKLVFVDNDNDGKYEVCHIEDYFEMAVASLNLGEENIYGKIYSNEESEVFYYGDYDKISVFKNGEQIRLSEIERNNVLSILAPKSASARLKIYVSDKLSTGYVNSINTRKDEIEVDGETYKFSKAFLKNVELKREKLPENGKTYLMYFDVFGKIFSCEIVKTSDTEYAYMRAIAETGNSMSQSYQVRIFTLDGKWNTKELSKKVRLNGEKTISAQQLYNTLAPTGVLEPTVIMFGVNSEGKINRIETPITKEGVDEERLISGGQKSRPYIGSLRELGYYDINIGADTRIMVVPDDSENEDSYSMLSSGRLASSNSYLCTPYNMDKFRVPELIVINDGENIRNLRLQQEMCVVTNKMSVLNSEGMAVEGLMVTSGAYEDLVITLTDNCSAESVKVGDLISVRFNNVSEAEEIRIWFSSSDGIQYLYPEQIKVMNQILSGRVIDINDDKSVVRVMCGDKDLCMRTMAVGTPVAFYDYDTNEAKTGSFADVAPGDFIVFKMTEMIMHSATVIENLK